MYRVRLIAERVTNVDLVMSDDSDMADDFPDDNEGEYDVRVRARIKAVALRNGTEGK
jgi:hypothetical protein